MNFLDFIGYVLISICTALLGCLLIVCVMGICSGDFYKDTNKKGYYTIGHFNTVFCEDSVMENCGARFLNCNDKVEYICQTNFRFQKAEDAKDIEKFRRKI